MYDITPETQNNIAKFESYMEGTVTVKDYGRIWVILIDSNTIVSVNVMALGDSFYSYTCDSGNLLQSGESGQETSATTLNEFIEQVLNDVAGEEWRGA